MTEMQAFTQATIEATKAVIKVMTEATVTVESITRRAIVVRAGPKIVRPSLRQPIFSWAAKHE